MENFSRVDSPRTRITGDIQRIDLREAGTYRAMHGDYGMLAAKETPRAVSKYPIGAVLKNMTSFLEERADGKVMQGKAPIPEDPEVLARHIKRLGYFLRADTVGICKIPEYAVYLYDSNGNRVDLNHEYAIVVVIDQHYETMCG
ncbi:MAG: hypothetical protein JRJ03_08905 [Deltaproteobacteria bacterium]|nr:hypothetical protein [Deltaproteobacteria bacterium]